MARSITRLFGGLVAAAALSGCAADPIPRPSSPDDPSNPDAAEVPAPKPPASLVGEPQQPAKSQADPPPAHHHHHHPGGSEAKQ